jgi:hypothetical protein
MMDVPPPGKLAPEYGGHSREVIFHDSAMDKLGKNIKRVKVSSFFIVMTF